MRMIKLLTILTLLFTIVSCDVNPSKPTDSKGNPIMAKFVKDDYGNIYRLDMCKCGCGEHKLATCLIPVDTVEYKVRVFENSK